LRRSSALPGLVAVATALHDIATVYKRVYGPGLSDGEPAHRFRPREPDGVIASRLAGA
jgi:hypothetical protein